MLSYWATQKELWMRLKEILENGHANKTFTNFENVLKCGGFFVKNCTIKVGRKSRSVKNGPKSLQIFSTGEINPLPIVLCVPGNPRKVPLIICQAFLGGIKGGTPIFEEKLERGITSKTPQLVNQPTNTDSKSWQRNLSFSPSPLSSTTENTRKKASQV